MSEPNPGNMTPEPTPAEPGQPEAMNRSRTARKGLKRRDLTRGEVELDDIHAVLNKQWVLIAILSAMVGINSMVVFMLLAVKF